LDRIFLDVPLVLLKRSGIDRMPQEAKIGIMYIEGAPQKQVDGLMNDIRLIQDVIGAAIQTALSEAEKAEGGELSPRFIRHMNAVALKMLLNMAINSVPDESVKSMAPQIEKWKKGLEDILSESRGPVDADIKNASIDAINKSMGRPQEGGQGKGHHKGKSSMKSAKANRKATVYRQEQTHKYEAKRILESIDMKVVAAMKNLHREPTTIDLGMAIQTLDEQVAARMAAEALDKQVEEKLKNPKSLNEIRHPWTSHILDKPRLFHSTRRKTAPVSGNLLRLIVMMYAIQFATGENVSEATVDAITPERLSQSTATAVETLKRFSPKKLEVVQNVVRQISVPEMLRLAKVGPSRSTSMQLLTSAALVNTSAAQKRSNALTYYSTPEFVQGFQQSLTSLRNSSASFGVVNKLQWTSAFNILKTVQSQGGGFAIVTSGELGQFQWLKEKLITNVGGDDFNRIIGALTLEEGLAFGDDRESAKNYIINDIVFEVEKDNRAGWGLSHIVAGTNQTATPIITINLEILASPPVVQIQALDTSIREIEGKITTLEGNILQLESTIADNLAMMSEQMAPTINSLAANNAIDNIPMTTQVTNYLMSFFKSKSSSRSAITLGAATSRSGTQVPPGEEASPSGDNNAETNASSLIEAGTPISFESLSQKSLKQLSTVLKENTLLNDEQKDSIERYIQSVINLNTARSSHAIQKNLLKEKLKLKFAKKEHVATLSINNANIAKLNPLVIKSLTQTLRGANFALVGEALKQLHSDQISIYVAGWYNPNPSNLPGYIITPEFRRLMVHWGNIHRNLINYHTLDIYKEFDTNLALSAISLNPSSTDLTVIGEQQEQLIIARRDFGRAITSLGTSLVGGKSSVIASQALVDFIKQDAFTRADADSVAKAIDAEFLKAAQTTLDAAKEAATDAASITRGVYRNVKAIPMFLGSWTPMVSLSFFLINAFLLNQEVSTIIGRIAASSALTATGAVVGSVVPGVGTAAGGTVGALFGLIVAGGALGTIFKLMASPAIVSLLVFATKVNAENSLVSSGIIILNIVGSIITVLQSRTATPAAVRNGSSSFFNRLFQRPVSTGVRAAGQPPPAGVATAVKRDLANQVAAAGQGGGARFTRRRPRKQRRRISHATKRSARR
jgi:hypothetical protein